MNGYWKNLAGRITARIQQQYWKHIFGLLLLSMGVGAGLLGEMFATAYVAIYLFGNSSLSAIASIIWMLMLIGLEFSLVKDYLIWRAKAKKVSK